MNPLRLSVRQSAILEYLREYIRLNNFAPTFEEIAEHFGYRSLSTVHEHLRTLEHKGAIVRTFNSTRGITIPDTEATITVAELRSVSSAEDMWSLTRRLPASSAFRAALLQSLEAGR